MCWLFVGDLVFFFKQKTAYEMRISDWSSDVCSSDLGEGHEGLVGIPSVAGGEQVERPVVDTGRVVDVEAVVIIVGAADRDAVEGRVGHVTQGLARCLEDLAADQAVVLALEEELRGLAGHVGERFVDAARLVRVLEVGILLGKAVRAPTSEESRLGNT